MKYPGFILILLFILVGQTFTQVCGDANCSGTYDISDLLKMTNYFYLTHDPIPCPDNADVDGLPFITNADLIFMTNKQYLTSEELNCPSPLDTTPPVYDVILSFFDNIVPANSSNWSVRIWEKNLDSIQTVAIPFSFSCPGVNLTLNSIDFSGTRYSDPHSIIDNTSDKGLIYNNTLTPLIQRGQGLIATLNFSLPPQAEDKEILLDTSTYIPSQHLIYTNIQDNKSYAFIPELYVGPCCIGYTGNVDCSYYEEPDISDITRLIDYLYISNDPLCCFEEADANGSGGEDPDISDITRIIDYLYLTHDPLPNCP